jgi:hypothetical protein
MAGRDRGAVGHAGHAGTLGKLANDVTTDEKSLASDYYSLTELSSMAYPPATKSFPCIRHLFHFYSRAEICSRVYLMQFTSGSPCHCRHWLTMNRHV